MEKDRAREYYSPRRFSARDAGLDGRRRRREGAKEERGTKGEGYVRSKENEGRGLLGKLDDLNICRVQDASRRSGEGHVRKSCSALKVNGLPIAQADCGDGNAHEQGDPADLDSRSGYTTSGICSPQCRISGGTTTGTCCYRNQVS
jgi:hypothetical protein